MAEGTVSKRVNPAGTSSWQARLDCGTLPNGKRDRWIRNFRTRREAHAALQLKREEVAAGKHRPRSETTLALYLAVWLAGKRGTIAASTFEDYTWWLDRHLAPQLGSVALTALSTVQIERWRDDRSAAGLSPRSVNYVLGLLKQICKRAALVDKLLADDPAAHVVLLRERKGQRARWQLEDVQRFVEAIATDRLYPLWLLAITTGMRRGELAGLRWSHIDLDAGVVRVQEARTLIGARPEDSSPKTDAGVRLVSLDHVTRSALVDLAVAQSDLRSLHGWTDTGHVFVTRTGQPFHPDYLTHAFARLVHATGLQHVTLHSLRSTAIALALTTVGGNVKLVSTRVGHARTDVTLQTYAYAFTDQDQAVAAAVGELLFGARHPAVTANNKPEG